MATAVFELSDLNGENGFVINGAQRGDASGISVNSAGDVNGDGFQDVVIGATYATRGGKNLVGESYVVFGKAGDFRKMLELSALDGRNGFVLQGIDGEDRLVLLSHKIRYF